MSSSVLSWTDLLKNWQLAGKFVDQVKEDASGIENNLDPYEAASLRFQYEQLHELMSDPDFAALANDPGSTAGAFLKKVEGDLDTYLKSVQLMGSYSGGNFEDGNYEIARDEHDRSYYTSYYDVLENTNPLNAQELYIRLPDCSNYVGGVSPAALHFYYDTSNANASALNNDLLV